MVTTLVWYWGFLGLIALERVIELVISNRNARWAFAQGAVETGQAHYRVMTALHTAFLIACVLEPWLLERRFPSPWGWIAFGVAIASQGLRYWAISTLGKRWNTRVIVLPTAEPVVGGPYRFIRHPNYVAVIAELAALPLIHGAWLTAAIFTIANALLLRTRIQVEERALGAQYVATFGNKPRFMP